MIETQVQETHQQKPSLTLTVPSWILAISKVVDYGAKAATSVGEAALDTAKGAGEKAKNNPFKKLKMPDFKFNFSKIKAFSYKKKAPLFLIIVFAVIGLVAWKMTGSNDNFVKGAAEQATVAGGKSVDINKSFDIPIKTKEGEETGEKLRVTILNMQQAKEILIQSNQAKAKDGKIFLLITMEIENPTKTNLTVKPIDMVRLISKDGKGLAADVHNDKVSSEPVSIKKTRIGYVVDEGDTNFKFLIGEVRGSQEPIEVSF